MNSSIDQIIEEIEDYIESCKFQPLSSTKIIVNKDEIQELIADLRHKTPEEVKRYADSMLKAIEDLLEGSQSIFKTNFAQLSSSMQKTLEIVSANRAELAPSEIFQDAAEEQVLEADMMPQEQEAEQSPE